MWLALLPAALAVSTGDTGLAATGDTAPPATTGDTGADPVATGDTGAPPTGDTGTVPPESTGDTGDGLLTDTAAIAAFRSASSLAGEAGGFSCAAVRAPPWCGLLALVALGRRR